VSRAYRENAAGEIEIFAHRWKTALIVGGLLFMTLACAAILVTDPGEGWGWLGVLFGGGLGGVLLRRYATPGAAS
jgi:hypothetical protein